MTVWPDRPSDAEVIDFLREAHVRGWPDGVAKIQVGGQDDFEQTTFRRDRFAFVDLYRGATTDVGMEVIFFSGQQIWGAVYRGGVTQSTFDREPIFGFLIEALRARSPQALPIRGPRQFSQVGVPYSYSHELSGTIGSFASVEQIALDGVVVYERITLGGWGGDREFYGEPIALPVIRG